MPIPFSKTFADYYTIGEFTADQYPNLMPEGQSKVDTIAVPAVLAAFNWAKGTERQKKIERLTERMFANWSKFQKPPFHPKWRDVNLAATVPGWTRLESAERELQKLEASQPATNASSNLNSEFQSYLQALGQQARRTAHAAEPRCPVRGVSCLARPAGSDGGTERKHDRGKARGSQQEPEIIRTFGSVMDV